ncbi:16S rRNA (cytosine(967)-C(5))-methyltransferase RsmB [Hathewaya histolytica]|uniref:16S rRNA (cytosine(967)-C(5))-methyltransferase RsmB n=1 Tax=Hathewaya histolytica TaxID=1498 RepID=UPI003B67F0E7
MSTNTRKVAVDIINEVLYKNAYSNLALNLQLKRYNFDERDRALITEIVYGTIKYKYTIDKILSSFLREGIESIDKFVLTLLRISIYQFKYLSKVPDFAIVNEAVEICKQYNNIKSSKIVNGVLRNFLRKGEPKFKFKNEEERLAYEFSYPTWMVKLFLKQYGKENTLKILKGLNERPSITVRVNPLMGDYEEVFEAMEKEGYEVSECDICPEGINIKRGSSIELNKLFKEGYITVQDESAMIVATLMELSERLTILDTCSAPGGKTTHIAELMNNNGEILACDIHEHKLKLIRDNASRLNIDIIKPEIRNAEEFYSEFEEKFHRVLVDAPCSGLGIIRKKPEIKWNKSEKDLKNLHSIQYNILNNSVRYVKKGGSLIYSTCTLNKDENEKVIKELLNDNPEFKVDKIYLGKAENIIYHEEGYITILPNENMDGFFMCKIKRQ